jgi:hypothetical protein
MNWYVYSSGLDTNNPPKLTTEQVIALINDNTIGKNAQIMQEGGTDKWIKITSNPDFAEALKSLKQRTSKKKTSKKIQIKETSPPQPSPPQQPVQQQPIQQQPVQQRPVQQQPVQQQPVQQHPVQQHPVQQHPVQQHPVQQQPTAKRRTVKYHNLERYLGFMTTFINVIIILCGACSLVGHVFTIYGSAVVISQEWNPNGYSKLYAFKQMQDAAQITLLIAISSLIISTALLLFIRMCLLAGVELIKVIVDIEKNTR